MRTHFKSFRIFHDQDPLRVFVEFLEDHQILYTVEDRSPAFDPSFAYNSFSKEYSVEIAPENFQKVYDLEQKDVEKEIENAPKDHYLYKYSKEELEEIVNARDEWNAYDYLLAKKILQERGVSIDEEQLEKQQLDRISTLKNVSNIKPIWLIIFYIVAFFGGFIAIFIGYYIMTAKKNLPNGETISRFTKQDKLHGNILFFAGIFFLIFWIIRGSYFFPFLHFRY